VERVSYKRQGWLGDKHQHQWLRVLERLFLHDVYIHADFMTKGDVLVYEWYVPRYLNKIKLVVNRRDGAGFNYLKFHMNVHVPRDIIKYSVPNNTNTEVGESNHKDITKKTAARTQLRSKQLDWQMGHRYWENLVVALCTVLAGSCPWEKKRKKGKNRQHQHLVASLIALVVRESSGFPSIRKLAKKVMLRKRMRPTTFSC
jgi:hypothetical protein